MKNTENQAADNVIEFRQKQEETKKKKWIQFPQHTGRVFLLLLVLCLAAGIASCKIKKINVEGTQYYDNREIKKAVKENYYIPNSILLKLRNRFFPIETMPFVEKIDIEIINRNEITIDVHESTRAGCIEYADWYVYFDKDGYALEVMNERLSDVPLVMGLSYNKMVIGEKLPVKKGEYFDKIVKITTLITKNELTIDEICFHEDGEIYLKKGKLDINLGTGTGLDTKLSVLPAVLKSLKKKSGTLYMDHYTEQHKIITFRNKK